jgi:hypothetical protein
MSFFQQLASKGKGKGTAIVSGILRSRHRVYKTTTCFSCTLTLLQGVRLVWGRLRVY